MTSRSTRPTVGARRRLGVPLRVLYATCLEVTPCRAGAEILKIQVTSLTDIPPDKLLISGIGEGRAPPRLPYALQMCLIRPRLADCSLPVWLQATCTTSPTSARSRTGSC